MKYYRTCTSKMAASWRSKVQSILSYSCVKTRRGWGTKNTTMVSSSHDECSPLTKCGKSGG